jgi:ATP-dependent DNA helicase RecQ
LLCSYFGENIGGDCGHCGWCAAERPGPLPPIVERSPGLRESQLLQRVRAEAHEALASPRQLARFFCGLSSPATTRAKLTRDPAFGSLQDVPFAKVMAWAASAG